MHAECSRMHEDPWGCRQLHKLACSYISLHAIMLACRSLSLIADPWACMQFPELSCSSKTLHAVPFFVWAAHKNFAVLVMIITGYQVNVHNRICYNSEKRTSSLLVSTVMKLWHTLWRQGCHNCHLNSNICLSGWFAGWQVQALSLCSTFPVSQSRLIFRHIHRLIISRINYFLARQIWLAKNICSDFFNYIFILYGRLTN